MYRIYVRHTENKYMVEKFIFVLENFLNQCKIQMKIIFLSLKHMFIDISNCLFFIIFFFFAN